MAGHRSRPSAFACGGPAARVTADRSAVGAVVLLIVRGVGHGAVPVCSRTWFAKAAPDSPEASSVLSTASFQATISLGALAGGTVLDRSSPSTVMVLGGSAAVLTALVSWAHGTGRPLGAIGRRPGRD